MSTTHGPGEGKFPAGADLNLDFIGILGSMKASPFSIHPAFILCSICKTNYYTCRIQYPSSR